MLNRTIQPTVNPIEHIDIVKAEKRLLSNGIPVHFVNAGSQDVVKLEFVFEAGTWHQPVNLIASLCNSMIESGSENYTAAETAEKFDFYGAYIQLGVDQNQGFVSIVSLGKHLSAILKVTEDLLKRPVFPEHEFEVLIAKNKQKFLLENEKVRTLCQKKFTQVLFGNAHPYAINNTIEDFDQVSREDLLKFYQAMYHSGNCSIIAAGKIDDSVLNLLETHFGGADWQRDAVKLPDFIIQSNPEKTHHVEKANGLQSAIRIGKFWVPKTHPDFHALSILITILGGYFGSRLMTNIREEKGYTYGIGSFIMTLKYSSYMAISTEVGNEYVDPTLTEIAFEMKRLQTELVSEAELENVKNYLLGEFLRDFDGPFALASSFKAISDFDLDYTFYDDYLRVLRKITSGELMKLAQQYLNPDDFYTVVAGSKA
ncbi:MAG TPA: pitrilysin family protein [Prolixibacteraceae bacterium]|nr:pitrilysin family protein [Prolixibacteraceae bacterium]